MFTIEFTHNGKRRQMQTDATTDESARVAFWNVRKQSSGEFELHLDTMKQHASMKDAEAEVARFRLSQGKPAVPTNEEIAQNSREVITNPAVFIPEEDDDEDYE